MSEPQSPDEAVPELVIDVAKPITEWAPGITQCRRCLNTWPTDRIQTNPKRRNYGVCCYCIAAGRAENMDRIISRRAEDLAQILLTDRGVAGSGMSTVEEFLGELDLGLGGARMIALRFQQIIDGLIERKAFVAAGTLLLQLQKLRFGVQKQHSDADYSLLNLEQKRDALKLEIVKFVSEQSVESEKDGFVEQVKSMMMGSTIAELQEALEIKE